MKRRTLLANTGAPPVFDDPGGGGSGGDDGDGGSGGSDKCPPGKVWDPRLMACVDELDGGGGGGGTTTQPVNITRVESSPGVQKAELHIFIENPNAFKVRCEIETSPDNEKFSEEVPANGEVKNVVVYRFNNSESVEQTFCANHVKTQKV